MKKYSLGLDLGIASVGWALFELQENENDILMPVRMEDCGVRIFEGLENPKDGKTLNVERRTYRGARRLVRRRKLRVKTTKIFLKDYFGFSDMDFLNNNNPILLKVKGLESKLSPEELSACLVHYVKHRGFKSNRINADASSEEGKLNKVIAANEQLLSENKMTVSQYATRQFAEHGKMHNSDNEYKFTFKRANYENEIKQLLDMQIQYKVINERFKEIFLDIWAKQRDFSDGPGPAKRKGNLIIEKSPFAFSIEEMLGKCSHIPNEYRAPKDAPSVEIFIAIQKLQNVRYKTVLDDQWKSIPHDIVLACLELAKTRKDVKYKDIKELLKVDEIYFKALDLSKKEYVKALEEFKKSHSIAKEEQIKDDNYAEFKKSLDVKKMGIVLIALPTYQILKKDLSSFSKMTLGQLDDIVNCLLINKTDKRIIENLKESSFAYSESDIQEIISLKNFSKTASVSLKYIYAVLPEMFEGLTLREAEEKHNLEIKLSEGKDASWLPPIHQICDELGEAMTNKNVLHTLTETRKILNLIIREYGKPHRINIELGRDLSRSFKKRREIHFSQLDNKTDNERAKQAICQDFGFPIEKIKSKEIIVWRLFKQQSEFCLYSMNKIDYKRLYEVGYVEVDHIIPQSRSFDDSFGNLALVFARENQEKGNCIPYEYFGQNYARWNKFTSFIKNSRLPEEKKEKLLLKSIADEDFMAKNLVDTQYATRMLANILKSYLNVEVNTYSGQMTAKLRAFWGLNGLTHSYESDDYKIKRSYRLIDVPLIANECVTFTFLELNNKTLENGKIEIKIVAKKKSEDKEDDETSKAVRIVGENPTPAEVIYATLIGKEISDKIDEIHAGLYKYTGHNEVTNAMITIHQGVRAKINAEMERKNRSNHLHHIIDAATIATFNKGLEKKIVMYNRKLELRQKSSRIDEKTGEIISYDPHDNEIEALTRFPLPYASFTKEVKLRVLERNLPYLKEQLQYLGYDEEDIEKVGIIFPSIATNRKVNKKMHMDTFYGMKDELATQRISIDQITKNDIDTIYDKSNDAVVINAVLDWINSGKKTAYPVITSKLGVSRPIKKVTVREGELRSKMIIGKDETRKAVKIDAVVRNDVYKQEGSDKLFFVQFNPILIRKERKYLAALKAGEHELLSANDFNVRIWWGQGKMQKDMLYSELISEYKPYIQIYPSELIEIEMKKGQKGYAISGGFSSGMFEIKSVLGDNYDLFNSGLVQNVSNKQMQLTISTIKNIKKINFNALGKRVHGL